MPKLRKVFLQTREGGRLTMKTRQQYVKPYEEDLEEYVESVEDACKALGYQSIDDAYENTTNNQLLAYIDGIYEFEKQLIRAHRRYDKILERLASKNKLIAEEVLKMKRRDEYIKAYLEEANRNYDELIDELVKKYKTDVEEEA